jgi:hypothetical protein
MLSKSEQLAHSRAGEGKILNEIIRLTKAMQCVRVDAEAALPFQTTGGPREESSDGSCRFPMQQRARIVC